MSVHYGKMNRFVNFAVISQFSSHVFRLSISIYYRHLLKYYHILQIQFSTLIFTFNISVSYPI